MKRFSKKIIVLAAALVVLIGLAVGLTAFLSRRPKFITPDAFGLDKGAQVTLIAERGLVAYAPENTAAAFVRAGENGYDGIHFELRRTADGVWVALREENIRHMTNGAGKIDRITYKQLLQTHIDKGKGLKAFKDEPLTVLTLMQALSICTKYNMTPVIEVKQSGTDRVEELLLLIGRRAKKGSVLIFAESEQLNKAQELMQNGTASVPKGSVQLCRFVEKLSDKTLAEAKKTPEIAVYFPAESNQNAETIRRFTDAALTLYAAGVNKPKQLRKLADAGVSRFITDKLAHQEITIKEEKTTKRSEKRTNDKPIEKPTAPKNTEGSTAAKRSGKPTEKPSQNAQ